MDKINIVVVAGPTASGKTGLAIDIARAFNGEVVSADSMQIYKYMDIGTAKPTFEERAKCPHHLIDYVEPDSAYSVADYTKAAHAVIADIAARGKLPVLCGGTGLYINSVINDIDFGEMQTDIKLRHELELLAQREGGEALIKILNEFDPVSAKRLHPNNIKRVIRAIEFYKTTGIPISEHQKRTAMAESRYAPIMFLNNYDRQVLYERINMRVDLMMQEGLASEVRHLMDMGYTRELNSMQGIGYKELMAYYYDECTLDEAIENIKQASRRYAKRQLTWFRRDNRINFLDPKTATSKALEKISESGIAMSTISSASNTVGNR